MPENNIKQDFELLNHLPIGNCIIDEDYKVLFWNNYLENSTEILKSEIIGSKLSDYFPYFINKLYINRLDSIFTGGAPVIFSSHLHGFLFNDPAKKNTSRINKTVVSAIPKPNSKKYYALFSIEDVTELSNKIQQHRVLKDEAIREVEKRKIIEQKLLIDEAQLIELNATKDKFFSIIAHDLKSPFNSILCFSELLINNIDKYDSQKQKQIMGYIHESAINTYKLLENLLTWSRSQSGRISYNPEKENLYLLVVETIDMLNQGLLKKSIKLTNNISGDSFAFVDKDMFSTIIRNLVSNAIKFTQQGGEIIIEECIITDESNRDFVKISVIDNGLGMSNEVQSKLFSITHNISTQGTENEHGTGLGLILCKEFVEKHRGEIWVESEEGKGSSFMFTIPKLRQVES